jgi:pentatricopeptide repeat protein
VAAKKPHDLKHLLSELDRANAPIKYYNYLIRAYIRLKDTFGAESVLNNLPIGVLPSARTFTLLIQEYLSTDLDRAYNYLKQMQDMSCKLHRSFDYIVVLRLHIRRDDPVAVDFAWKDMLQHKDSVNPTMQLYTTYLGYLGSKKKYEKASEVVQDLVAYSRLNDSLQKSLSSLQYKTIVSMTNQLALNDQPQSAKMLVKFLLSSTLASPSATGLPEGLLPTIATTALPSEIYTNIINGYVKLEKYSHAIDFHKEMSARKDVQLEPEVLRIIREARECMRNRQSKQQQQYHDRMYIANLAPA